MIVQTFSKYNLDINNIYLMGCDGTNTNTGTISGIIRRMEVMILYVFTFNKFYLKALNL